MKKSDTVRWVTSFVARGLVAAAGGARPCQGVAKRCVPYHRMDASSKGVSTDLQQRAWPLSQPIAAAVLAIQVQVIIQSPLASSRQARDRPVMHTTQLYDMKIINQ